MKYSCVIWDWNGTLADDAEVSRKCTNDILAKRNMPPITMEQYYSYIDTPISRFYEHLFDLSVVSMEELAPEFQEGYKKYFSSLHTGAAELVRDLHERGVTQVILTSGNQGQITGDVKMFGLDMYISEILGASDFMAAGKVQRGLDWAQKQTIPPTEMVLVGDTLHDCDTARALGVDCILFSGGHQAKKDLETRGRMVADSFSELRALLL